MTVRRAGLVGIVMGATLALAAYGAAALDGAASPIATWLMVAAIATTIPSCLLLGGVGVRRQTLVLVAAVFTFVVLGGCLALALTLPADAAREAFVLGIPRRLAVVVYGIGVLPFLVLPALFARWFDTEGLDPDGLAELRRRAASLRAPE